MLKRISAFSAALIISFLLLITSLPFSGNAASSTYDASLLTIGVSSSNEALFESIKGYGGCEPRYGFEWRYYDSNSTVPDDDYYYLCFIFGSSQTDWYTHFVRVPKACCDVSVDSSGVVSFSRLSSANMDFKTYHSSFNTDPTRYVAIQDFSFSDTLAPHSDNSTLNSEFNRYSSTYPSYNYLGYYLYDVDVSFAPDIEVNFAPDLDGCINLVYDSSWMPGASSTVTLTSFDFWVTNNTNQPYIYNLTIYDSSYTNVIYRFLKYEWCMSIDLKSQSLTDAVYIRQLQGSAWHLVQAGDTVHNVIKWSQVNLQVNTIYNVEVQAVPNVGNDFDTTSYIMPLNTGLANFDVDTVYTSSFSITDMGNIVYSHDDEQFDIIPYESEEDFVRASLTRKASYSQGSYDYNNYSAFDDKNSLYYAETDAGTYFRNNYAADKDSGSSSAFSSYFNPVSFSSNGVSPVSFTSLSAMITQFMQFSNTTLSYFPSAILSVFTLGLVSVVVIGLIKAVFR